MESSEREDEQIEGPGLFDELSTTDDPVTTGIRSRVVDKAKERLITKQPDLSQNFLEQLSQLLNAENLPKADAFLQIFDKQARGDL